MAAGAALGEGDASAWIRVTGWPAAVVLLAAGLAAGAATVVRIGALALLAAAVWPRRGAELVRGGATG